MSHDACAWVREAIPDFVSGRLETDERAAVEAHRAQCAECAAEIDVARALFAGRPSAPSGLAERVTTGLARRRARGARPWWGVSAVAAASVALALGITARSGTDPLDVPGYAYEIEEGEVWSSDDGLLAGAPSLDLLSDEALQQLLEELSAEGPGGAA